MEINLKNGALLRHFLLIFACSKIMSKQDELLYQIALTMVPKVGAVLSRTLLAYCSSAKDVFKQTKGQLLRIPGIGEKIASEITGFADMPRAEKEITFIEKHKIKALTFLDKEYPQRMRDLADAPFIIYSKGNIQLNTPRMIAVVGTRKASEYAKNITQKIVEELKPYNVTIVSGLAYGIDAVAHKAAVKNEIPTIGVMATGLDVIYPAANKSLATSMLEMGGILTEYPSGVHPDMEHFPARNRIVAGMTDATIVVESAARGGSLITAEIANSYDRDVFAVPGRAGEPLSAGCNHLIKVNKAHLIETAADLAYILGWDENQKPVKKKQMPSGLSDTEQDIYALLKEKEKIEIDHISMATGYTSAELSIILLEMEFKGILQTLPGKCYRLV